MKPRRSLCLAFTFVLIVSAAAQQRPLPQAAEWWRLTTALSNDSMQGRDTGTEAYERAAKYVADQFQQYGLQPSGDHGTYFQRVAMHEIDLDTAHSAVDLLSPEGKVDPLRLLYETTLVPRTDMAPLTEGRLVFLGYGAPDGKIDLRGKIAVYFNGFPAGMPVDQRAGFTGRRIVALGQMGIVGIIGIDNPAATEPTHWPAAYARTVTLADAAKPAIAVPFVGIRISAEAAPRLFAGSGADAAQILANAEKGLDLPSMPLARTLRIRLQFTQKEISSPNILAVLPGSDPALASEYVALSAHLDGYGFGTPVLGDSLYNGALDDAAYVATLLELAGKLSVAGVARPKRSLLFCVFTGEEKGLLGSQYFTQHLTVPKDKIVADLNLDQLRPIFPLKVLTMEGIGDSTLGQTTRGVAQRFGIELRPDREPERNLFRRADNYNFVRIGVPIASFIFGYDPGSPEERIYRDWYARRYHKPQDDLSTPIDWAAAVAFNDFYRALAFEVADSLDRPKWLTTSDYMPRP